MISIGAHTTIYKLHNVNTEHIQQYTRYMSYSMYIVSTCILYDIHNEHIQELPSYMIYSMFIVSTYKLYDIHNEHKQELPSYMICIVNTHKNIQHVQVIKSGICIEIVYNIMLPLKTLIMYYLVKFHLYYVYCIFIFYSFSVCFSIYLLVFEIVHLFSLLDLRLTLIGILLIILFL